ncbi:MAG: SUMF1/EgtB/PvdO family nonheme iron enzyme [Deltaproteobacteria bacterium]|nr:SUMF1/EgtB/PvdO family nonheme iron enzyme [Deltaproteobacteria bacterium]
MQVCAGDCETWENVGACIDGCSRPPMPSRSGADPVCIPAGPFIMGTPDYPNAQPVTEVMLSEFYLDRFPVTNMRAAQCRDDGGCPTVDEFFSTSELSRYYMANLDEARRFCIWDGGTVVSEAQWEKAGRGFAPDERPHSWGVDPGDEDMHPVIGARTHPTPDAFPLAVSPFGVRQMGSTSELTDSYPILDYSTISPTDPFYPGDDDYTVARGAS